MGLASHFYGLYLCYQVAFKTAIAPLFPVAIAPFPNNTSTIATYFNSDRIISLAFPELNLTAEQVFAVGV